MSRLLILVMLLGAAAASCSDAATDAVSTPSPSPSGAEATAVPTLAQAQPPAATPGPDVVARLKADLANKLGVAPVGIDVVRLEAFTWPDGCLGLGGPGVVCTQALVPGWLAVLRGPGGDEYRYRGAGDRFAREP